jgi:hypothetical protein
LRGAILLRCERGEADETARALLDTLHEFAEVSPRSRD